MAQVLDYYPYGSERISTGDDSTDRHFIGERFDDETDLSYLNARYYEGSRGQFLSQDPVFKAVGTPELEQLTRQQQRTVLSDPQVLNAYNYARNNPIRFKDPEGRWVHIAIGAGAGIVGQYGYDVYNNIQRDGFGATAFTSNLSNAETYATRAAQGAVIAATGGVAGAITANVAGQAAIVGGASGVTGIIANTYLDQPFSIESFAIDAIVGGTTFGVGSVVPKVPGRLPNFGTRAFFTGKHTQQSAMNLWTGAGSNYISAILNDISRQIKDIQGKLDKLKESNNGSNNKKKDR